MLPVANPDGLIAETRFNTHGVDLNRNFPAANRQNTARFGLAELSEPEAVVIKDLMDKYEPDVIISIHQPLNCIDYDGPAEDLARVVAENCDLPVRKLGAMPGSLGSYSGLVRGIPIITFELPGDLGRVSRDELWERYSPALLAAIAYPAK
jgi:protein MpaA